MNNWGNSKIGRFGLNDLFRIDLKMLMDGLRWNNVNRYAI